MHNRSAKQRSKGRDIFLAAEGLDDIWEGLPKFTYLKRVGKKNNVNFKEGI